MSRPATPRRTVAVRSAGGTKAVRRPWFLAVVLAMLAAPAILAQGLTRDRDPVVLTGASLPTLTGKSPSRIVGFAFSGGWTQIPVQVDERAVVDFGQIYGNADRGVSALHYTDAGTFTGADPDAAFDADDELVLMSQHAAARWDGSADPAGVVAGTRVELQISDPLDGSLGYAYLFETDGTLDPAAGVAPIDYAFVLLSGDYKTTYRTNVGPNPENSTVVTPFYSVHFADRWVRDETRVHAGGAPGVDILDRHKFQFGPGNCGRTHRTFSDGHGAFIVNRSGPLRALRGYQGANSGPTTYRVHRFYEDREEILTALRVHPIPGLLDTFDYSPEATGMVFRDDFNPDGVTIDGVPDAVTPGEFTWELVTGDQGTLGIAGIIDTDIPNPGYTSYYEDNTSPPLTQCTGDAFEYGHSGMWKDDGMLNTDPERTEPLYKYEPLRVIRYGAPNQPASFATTLRDYVFNPLQVAVDPDAGCPDGDGDGYAVCDGVCTPDPGDQCGDCDDASGAVNPGAAEVCGNGVDEDCDGQDAACPACPDGDGDGYAVCDGVCVPDAGDQCGDCDDASGAVNPGAAEVCGNGIDEDCDGQDAACPACADADADGYAVCDGVCVPDPGDACGDCDDTAAAVNPGMLESEEVPDVCWDQLDNDCDGLVDEADASCTRYVDFGPETTPAEAGYERDGGLPFDLPTGYGWLAPGRDGLSARERTCAGVPDRQRTFLFPAGPAGEATWELALANGAYDVAVGVGDCLHPQGPQRVRAENVTLVDDETTAAGVARVHTGTVRVLDGRLSLAVGGSTGNTVLNVAEVVPAAAQPSTLEAINFQAPGATTPPGFSADVGEPYDAAAGRGWSRNLAANARSRGMPGDPARDGFVYASDGGALYELDLANGAYDVKLAVGDPLYPQGPHRVVVEGLTVLEGSTGGGEFVDASLRTSVTDGRLSVEIGGTGGGGNTTLSFLSAAAVDATRLAVNFQPAASVTPPGYETDSGATFDGARGFGWLASQGDRTRERGLDPDPRLDTLLYVAAPAQVWEAGLPFGDYAVTVTVGDAAYAQGPHVVRVEGVDLFAGETTASGEFLARTVRVPVRDGRLTIETGGGATGFTSVNSFEIDPLADLIAVSFQPEGSAAPAGFEVDAGRAYDPVRGHGWTDDAPFLTGRTRERGLIADRSRDTFLFTGAPPETWRLDLPNGDYRVTAAVGDAAWPQGPQRVVAEGTVLVDGETTGAGAFRTRAACVTIADGALTLEIGGAAGNTTLNYVRVSAATCGP